MTYENFLKVILQQQKCDRIITEAYKLKIDLIEFGDPYHDIINTLIKEIYGKKGYDWYSWFCCEAEYGQKNKHAAWDDDGTPICYSFETLWEYLEKNHLIINKEKPKVMKESKQEFISLYDFVGHRDVDGNAKKLYNFAISCGVKPQTRDIETPKYKGKVRLYPRAVIKSFFKLSSLNK